MTTEWRAAGGVLSALLLSAGACLVGCSGAAAEDEGSVEQESVSAHHASRWVLLGDSLNPAPEEEVAALALSAAPALRPGAQPLVGFSTASQTRAFVLTGNRFKPLGEPLPGPSSALALGSRHDIYACTADTYLGGPFVHRWDGSRWRPVGGDISVETGYARPAPQRYVLQGCGDIVLAGAVPVVAWSALVGAKAHAAYVARFNAQQGRWEGLEPGISGRNPDVALAVDEAGPLHAVTFSPGGSYAGGNTTRVWRFGASGWSQLGSDLPDTTEPRLATRDHALYLALGRVGSASGVMQVLRWQGGAWRELPSPGEGSVRSLALTDTGRPLVAFTDLGVPARLRVSRFADGAWRELGSGVADVNRPGLGVVLDLDARDRPVVLFSDSVQEGSTQRYDVQVARYGGSVR
ncbi:MAG: hypothetical protein U1A78_41865 [Polyangia bacterium]